MFDTNLSQMDAKIDKKLDEKLAAVNSLNEKIKDNDEVTVIDKKMNGKIEQESNRSETQRQTGTGDASSAEGTATETNMYASKLAGPQDLRKMMKEAQNEEKIEVREQEQRSNNFIIHGAEEFGDNVAAIKKNDKEYILDILHEIKVINCKPKSITRLGKQEANKGRAIKVEMNNKEEKQKVMSNLKYLKGTEDFFGKIRITDDYTREERDMLREWVKKAEEKSRNDG